MLGNEPTSAKVKQYIVERESVKEVVEKPKVIKCFCIEVDSFAKQFE